jgi:2-dehydropantoate 2-reductase
MGQDIMKGRRTEIDFINGLVAAKGAELKIATPANSSIVHVVRRVERGEIPPSPEAVAAI